jgi:inosine/xanthosine triphosphatase
MYILVGSANPVKINAVKTAIVGTPLARAEVLGFEVATGVAAQPWGSEETRQGARNRASAVLALGRQTYSPAEFIALGFEGGVYDLDGEVWSTVWCSVMDTAGNHFETNGASFQIPEPIATHLREGGELGPAVDAFINDTDVSKKQGAIGVFTSSFANRTEEYSGLAKLAIGLWYGKDWQTQLDASKRTQHSDPSAS